MSQTQGWPQAHRWGEPEGPRPPRRGGMPIWAWVLLVLGLVGFLSCASCIGGLMWIGLNSPDTWAYAGNEVPPEYLQTMRDVGALDADENLIWFYSDGMLDIEDGFYFVSDKKLLVYRDSFQPPLTAVAFDDIAEVDIVRGASWIEDSFITVTLKDGDVVAFPVSIERDGDLRFVEAIEARIE